MKKFEEAVKEVLKVLEDRNRTYGDNNLIEYGLLGILVRLRDKLARLEYFLIHPNEEAIKDALIDIAGYAINALRLIKENKLNITGRLNVELMPKEGEHAR